MTIFRRSRFVYWLLRDLTLKYHKALLFGFFLGLVSSILFWRLGPSISRRLLSPVQRIAMVGEFSPSTLPISIQQQISLGLTTLAADGSPAAGLAQSWETTDAGKLYTFHLRSDLLWHNGKPVVAADVNYNIKDSTFEPADTHTLRVRLKDAFSPFPVVVSKPIVAAGLRGFGSYRVDAVGLKGDSVQFIRLYPTSGTGTGKEYRFYRTEAAAVTAFKHGDVDTIEDLASSDLLPQWGTATTSAHPRYDQVVALFFSTKDPVLSDKALRQGLAYATPDLGRERAYSPISKTSWAYTDKVRRYDYNEAQAAKLLKPAKSATASAGLTITTFPQYVDVAQTIASAWSTFGLSVQVKVETALSDTYQVLLTAQSIPPDPDQYPFWHSTQRQTNITGYSNVKIDKLLEDGRTKTNIGERKTIYANFQRFLLEDVPALFLYYPATYTISRHR